MTSRIAIASPVLLLLFAATWAGAQEQVYKCGGTNVYTDKPCDNASLVDLNQSNNILQPGPTYVAPPPPPETPQPPFIVPNTSRLVTSPAASPSDIWSQRDSRQGSSPATPANSLGRSGSQ